MTDIYTKVYNEYFNSVYNNTNKTKDNKFFIEKFSEEEPVNCIVYVIKPLISLLIGNIENKSTDKAFTIKLMCRKDDTKDDYNHENQHCFGLIIFHSIEFLAIHSGFFNLMRESNLQENDNGYHCIYEEKNENINNNINNFAEHYFFMLCFVLRYKNCFEKHISLQNFTKDLFLQENGLLIDVKSMEIDKIIEQKIKKNYVKLPSYMKNDLTKESYKNSEQFNYFSKYYLTNNYLNYTINNYE